jgi:hypothetical protein
MRKVLDVQGHEVTMRSVLQQHGNVERVLGPELVTDLIRGGTAVNIGGRLQPNTDFYEARVFKREIWFPLVILQDKDTYPDVFAVSGIEESQLVSIVPSYEVVGIFHFDEESVTGNTTDHNDVSKTRFIVLEGRNLKSSFSQLCEKYRTKTFHWLKYKDGKLLWKKTYGDNEKLLNYIDAEIPHADGRIIAEFMRRRSCEVNEKSIWDLGGRVVLVVAKPGMGKSSTTTQVAWNTKLADPTSWVVRINWNDHTRKLQDIDTANFNLDSLVEFLCSAAMPESKYTDINRSLLKQALQYSGNVTVLMDGFDEISPTHADKAFDILSELMRSKVKRVWVTSRPVQKERLERELRVTAFSMKKLSNESQRKMLTNIWKETANGENKEPCLKNYVERLLSQANESHYQRNFTGCPLHITMIACAFERNLEASLNSGEISLPDKLDFLELYDQSIERKLHIYKTEKKREDLTNAGVQDEHERLMEMCTEKLERCSLLVTLPSDLNPIRDEATKSKILLFLETVQTGKDKIGIIMNVVEKTPHFVHRTFAEYLTACWFCKNFESNRDVMIRVLFDSEYGFVKDMFDMMLAKGFDLHCAVLNGHCETVVTLLQGQHDVNSVDSGGRTALHLIAAQGRGGHLSEEITNSLLKHRDCVDKKDRVMKWTALDYAIKAKNWFVVERLLERKYKTDDLEFIRQRVEEASNEGKIIDDIQDENCKILLHHLASICQKHNGLHS